MFCMLYPSVENTLKKCFSYESLLGTLVYLWKVNFHIDLYAALSELSTVLYGGRERGSIQVFNFAVDFLLYLKLKQ